MLNTFTIIVVVMFGWGWCGGDGVGGMVWWGWCGGDGVGGLASQAGTLVDLLHHMTGPCFFKFFFRCYRSYQSQYLHSNR